MTHEELIRDNAYNTALLDALDLIDIRDYQLRRNILNLWKDGPREDLKLRQTVKVTIHDQVTI